MNMEVARAAVEIISALTLGVGSIWLIRHYTTRKRRDGSQMGIGLRAVQIVVSFMTIPAVLILALERLIPAEVAGTLLGTLLGYVLSPKESEKVND